ncbi:hypothetical protein ABZY93_15220 [Streptomyces smyrnaeus]|uniref:hypothetical protein n=1 Tax=Streptomyces smyrnaeus TaxID=1387713 RepID=UPI0033A81BE0
MSSSSVAEASRFIVVSYPANSSRNAMATSSPSSRPGTRALNRSSPGRRRLAAISSVKYAYSSRHASSTAPGGSASAGEPTR